MTDPETLDGVLEDLLNYMNAYRQCDGDEIACSGTCRSCIKGRLDSRIRQSIVMEGILESPAGQYWKSLRKL